MRWAQLHSKASCDAPSPVSHSIINKPYVLLSMTNTMGRWWISQSDGGDSRAKLSSKIKKALFSQTRRTKDPRQLCRVSAVPTFENGGPLLVPHLFELPSEVPRWEWIQGQAGKAPQDGLVQSLRALRLTLSHVPHGSLLRWHVGRRRALRCSNHSSMWSRPPDSPVLLNKRIWIFSLPPSEQPPVQTRGGEKMYLKKMIILPCRDAARAVSLTACWCALTPALVRAVQQVTVTFMNWAGIGLLGQPLPFLSKGKKKRERREGQSHEWVEEGGGGGGGGGGSLDSHNISAHCMPTRHSWINILYLSWSRTHQCPNRYVVPLALLMRPQKRKSFLEHARA